MPVVEVVLPSTVLPELVIKLIPCEKVLRVVMELFDITLLLVLPSLIPCAKVPLVSMLQFLISTPVTLSAEIAVDPLPVVVTLKPAQSRITLFDPAPFKMSAAEGQFISESRVVLVVNNAPHAGVTACTLVVFSNIRTPASQAVRIIMSL